MQVLVFYYQYRSNKDIHGPGWWLTWSATESVAFILMFMRNIPAIHYFAVLNQNLLILSGTIFIYIGIVRFFNKKVNLKFILIFFICFTLIHTFFVIIKDNIFVRSVIISLAISIVSFFTAFSIQRFKEKPVLLTANLNIVIFIIHGTIFAFRAIMILSGVTVADVFEATFFNLLPYADALIVSLLWTFGFIMMLNQKLNSEIIESKSRFELIFENSPDGALISRLDDGMIIEFNETFSKLSGYSDNELKGNTTLNLQVWQNPVERSAIVKLLKEKGICENMEIQVRRKGGEQFTGLISAKTISLSGIPHMLSVTRDISLRKKEDEAIRLKNEELKRINLEKDKLFSVIAHDLRNPFTAFIGLTDMMAEETSEMTIEEMHNIAVELKKSSTNLFGLLENLLEWSRVEQGLIRFNPVSTPLLPLTEDSITKLLDQAKSKKIGITCSIPNELNIYADINVFQSIVRNLVSNAIKFTPRGGNIFISAIKTDGPWIEMSVKDSGIGMSAEMVENLFKLDSQSNRKGTMGEPSTGLGLILCKGFIEKQGGRIRVESQEGKGSVFYFTMPCMI
jgi:PAS domain S-box-containing protein